MRKLHEEKDQNLYKVNQQFIVHVVHLERMTQIKLFFNGNLLIIIYSLLFIIATDIICISMIAFSPFFPVSFYPGFTPFTAPYSDHLNIKNGAIYCNILFVVSLLVFIVL